MQNNELQTKSYDKFGEHMWEHSTVTYLLSRNQVFNPIKGCARSSKFEGTSAGGRSPEGAIGGVTSSIVIVGSPRPFAAIINTPLSQNLSVRMLDVEHEN